MEPIIKQDNKTVTISQEIKRTIHIDDIASERQRLMHKELKLNKMLHRVQTALIELKKEKELLEKFEVKNNELQINTNRE